MLIDGLQLTSNTVLGSGLTVTDGKLTSSSTLSQLTNDAGYQTESDVTAKIQSVVGAAPEALDTLQEIATQLQENELVSDALAASIRSVAYDIATAVVNKPSANAKVLRFAVPRPFTIPANAEGSIFKSAIAATATTTFSILKNGSPVGTITFEAESSTASATMPSVDFIAGDILMVTAPPVQDLSLSDLTITFVTTQP